MPAMLSKDIASSRNSVQSATGSLLPSKIVPVAGPKPLPQDRQRHLRTPLESNPSLTTAPDPHRGQLSRS